MGAFMVFDIGFKSLKDRKKFEVKYNIKKKQILVDENANSGGFGAWTIMRDIECDVIYYMGFMGYAEPIEILKECKKENIKIKFFAWIPINDRDSYWNKEKGRWEGKSVKNCYNECLTGDEPLCKDKYCLVNKGRKK